MYFVDQNQLTLVAQEIRNLLMTAKNSQGQRIIVGPGEYSLEEQILGFLTTLTAPHGPAWRGGVQFMHNFGADDEVIWPPRPVTHAKNNS